MVIEPANLRILEYPDARLRQRADPVPTRADGRFADAVAAAAARMIELMRSVEGIGLAATQVGLPWRLFVVHVPPNEERSAEADPPTATPGPVIYINPVITPVGAEVGASEEGCLSLPEIRGDVIRPLTATITARDLQGREFRQTAGGLLARCWQHENDHLDGVLIIDRMTQMSRLKNRAAVRDLERQTSRGERRQPG